jgi:hypothetical protein
MSRRLTIAFANVGGEATRGFVTQLQASWGRRMSDASGLTSRFGNFAG